MVEIYWSQPIRAVGQGLWLLGILAGSLGCGQWLLRRLGFNPKDQFSEMVLGIALGLAVLSYAVFLLCVLQILSPLGLAGLTLAWILMGSQLLRNERFRRLRLKIKSGQVFQVLLLGYLGFNILVNLLRVLTPAVDWDGVAYHLALPKIYLVHGGFVFRPDIFHNLFPQFTEMLYMLGLLFPYATAAKLIHFTFGLLTAAAVYILGKHSRGFGVGLLGAVIFYAQFLVHIESGTAFVDLAVAAYFALGLVAWQHSGTARNNLRWKYLAIFFIGITAAIKWQGLVLLMLAAVYGIIQIGLEKSLGRKSKLKGILFLLGWGGLPVLPYLLRAWVMGNNPVWPLAYKLFGGRDWDTQIAERVSRLVADFAGMGKGVIGFLRLPYDLVIHGSAFGVGGRELSIPLIGGFVLAIVWLFLAGRGYLNRNFLQKKYFWVLPGIVAFLIFMAIWFWSSPQTRFLLPLFPLGAWLAGCGLYGLWDRPGRVGKIASLCLGLMFFAFHPPVHKDSLLQARVITGLFREDDYCARKLRHYPACQYLNHTLFQDERVLLFGENRGFYLDADYLWGDPMIQKVIDYRVLKTPQRLRARLQELGVGWVLFRTDMYDEKYLDPEIVHLMEAVLEHYGEERYAHGSVKIFELPADK